ncbi:glutamate 5-kinase [Calderihabitans maritimus]|uniref:Glutamate 5-kinase n=1 Tax=Calderihabitans maritimus TaxID=1246530 RepID=A0A1Z5HUX2_9FIRM|nr:glutamate 5-kinase [Calderihabitans maritimus]GAW93339.1 gamma-glutamyl kinase [Calderihabitans maritimus]
MAVQSYVKRLQQTNRLVVKVGTSSLTHSTGKLNLFQLEKIVRQVADIANQGKEIVLVTSGAVGAGMGKLGFREKPRTIPDKQAAAAVGQGILLHMYEKLFAEYGHTVAQVLLTREDLADRKRYLNARNALATLLHYRVIPIVNENDTIAVEEIRLGDNDTLAALVAGLVDADLLMLLTDTDGFYTADPQKDPDAKLLTIIEDISADLEKVAEGAGSTFGTGGMETKLHAAKISMNFGIPMIIANGFKEGVIWRNLQGEITGTLFIPRETKLHSKKRWIAYGSDIQGAIHVDAGAAHAILEAGKSLLPIGVVRVEGNFEPGNVVSVISPEGVEIARGIVNYSSQDIDKIKGRRTSEIAEVLGHKDYDEVIHRNNLTVKI